MKNVLRAVQAVTLSVCLLVASACEWSGGPMSRLDDALTLAPSFVTAVEVSGAISPVLAADLRADLIDAQKLKGNVTTCHKNIASDDSAKDFKKAQCYVAAGLEGQRILARHFSQVSNPKIQVVAQLINDCLQILINHFNQPAGLRGASSDDFEKQLDAKVAELKKKLEER